MRARPLQRLYRGVGAVAWQTRTGTMKARILLFVAIAAIAAALATATPQSYFDDDDDGGFDEYSDNELDNIINQKMSKRQRDSCGMTYVRSNSVKNHKKSHKQSGTAPPVKLWLLGEHEYPEPDKQITRGCVPRGGSCDHRPNDCCYNSACRCNLWGANCRCQRKGIFQKWGKK